MSDINDGTVTLAIERELSSPPDQVWRALTDSNLIEQWLMPNDFQLKAGQAFKLNGDWGTVDCTVLQITPGSQLKYSWVAFGLDSTVTYTLTPVSTGTLLRVEQAGFKPDQQQFYDGAKGGWQRFMANLEQVVASLG